MATARSNRRVAGATGADLFSLCSLEELRVHPEAALVPDMSGDEYAQLLADVRERGMLTPLEVNAAMVVLDGRHRLRAARDLGLERVPIRTVEADDELAYIVLAAVNRRHLNASQRAALTVELEAHMDRREAARLRSRANLSGAEGATLPTRQERSRESAAQVAGVSGRTIQDAQAVYEADPDLFVQVKRGSLPAHRAAKQVRRQRKLEALPTGLPLPEGRFELLYADPPWRSSSPRSDFSPEQHYPTMRVEEIENLRVPAAENALLFLWAVNGQLPEALQVMSAWGFAYRTNLVWVKPSIGLGHWARNRHELLLIGRRGAFPLPDEPDRPDSVIEAKRRAHSQKPECVYQLLERMYPAASKLELFARQERPGWIAWGNEVAA